MITLGVLGCTIAAVLVLTLLAFSKRFDLAAAYRRVAWVPVAALLIEAALWKPLLASLSYFGAVFPLLTGIASLFLATVGATLVATARARNEDTTEMLRATLVAAIPGMMLLALIFYGLVNAWLGSRGA
jgi:hypothetical protein